METIINTEGLNSLKQVFFSMSRVELQEPRIKTFTFEVVFDNIINEDGSNFKSPVRYTSYGEDMEEAKHDILEYNEHLKSLVRDMGYQIKDIIPA